MPVRIHLCMLTATQVTSDLNYGIDEKRIQHYNCHYKDTLRSTENPLI